MIRYRYFSRTFTSGEQGWPIPHIILFLGTSIHRRMFTFFIKPWIWCFLVFIYVLSIYLLRSSWGRMLRVSQLQRLWKALWRSLQEGGLLLFCGWGRLGKSLPGMSTGKHRCCKKCRFVVHVVKHFQSRLYILLYIYYFIHFRWVWGALWTSNKGI